MSRFLRIVLVPLLAASCLLFVNCRPTSERPNILFILTDDHSDNPNESSDDRPLKRPSRVREREEERERAEPELWGYV